MFLRCQLTEHNTAWRRSPHSVRAVMTESSVRPCSVKLYSTVTGVVANTCRIINSFCSRPFNSFDNMRGAMPPTARCSSRNRIVPSVRKVDKIKSFHLPPTISRVSLIGRRFLALRRQRSLIFSNKGGLPVCGPLFVIKAVVKRHRPCIM